MFSFEALNARHGDCLLLHFGKPENPRLIVIDGGPTGVFEESLRPRLMELREERGLSERDAFKTDMVMVTHIDDDHICGILEWFRYLAYPEESWEFLECWFNSFPDVIKRSPKRMKAAVGDGQVLRYPNPSNGARAIMASIPKGRELRDYLAINRIQVNGGKDLLFVPDSVARFSKEGLTLTLLAPNRKAVERLEEKWKKAKVTTAALDNTIENLSSLVVMATCEGHRVLLTGDARSDYILEGLEDAGYLEDGQCTVDVMKLPHHSSSRNCTEELFKTVHAEHYVISANGRDDNPDADTLCLIAEVRGEASDFSVYITNAPNEYDPTSEGRNLFRSVSCTLRQYPWLENRFVFGSPEHPVRIDLAK